jgi:Metal-dependent hydrolases of the beta-lactamase superfamily I
MDIKIDVLASSSHGNCYLISDGQTQLMLEAGIPFKEIKIRSNFGLSKIEAVLITHEHGDHAKALPDLLKIGMNCYLTQGTADSLILQREHRLKIIQAKKQFEIGSWMILPFETEHDAAEPVGFLLASRGGGKVLFATDTFYLKYKFKGLTHIMVECNYSSSILKRNISAGAILQEMKNRLLKSHFSLENLKEFFKSNDLSKVQEIHLLHLSDGNSDEDLFKKEIMKATGKMVFIAKK